MENNFFRRIPTDLDLNGPVLEYTTQPSDATGDKDATVTFTVAAQVLFPGESDAENGGTITFQWFEVDGSTTGLIDGSKFSGVTTATLTVNDLETPQDQGRKFYCEVSYLQNNEYDSADSGTGTAINQPLKSDEATLSVNPELEIVAQPSDRTVGKNVAATFSVNASLTDSTYLNNAGITYEWYVGLGNNTPTKVTDGTVTTTNITSEVVTIVEEGTAFDTETFTENKSFGGGQQNNVIIPPTGSNVSFTIAAGGGGRGGDDAGGSGGGGGSGRVGTFTMPNPQARGRTLNFWTGNKGSDGGRGNFPAYGRPGSSNIAPGGRGGGAGPRGWSGGGGGGGGASGVLRDGSLLIAVCGGGGGGGGGSHRSGTAPTGGAGLGLGGRPFTSTINTASGGSGQDQGSDGGGGGGAGGGVSPQRSGGGAGRDKTQTGRGGEGGRSGYRSDIVNFIPPGGGNHGSGYANISFQYTVTTSRPITTTREETVYTTTNQNTIISGQGTPTLSITSDDASFNSVRNVYVVVSHPSATNSPLTSDTVKSVVVDQTDPNNLVIETIAADGTANIQTVNLSNGDEELVAGATDINLGAGAYLYSIYAPDKSIDVEMDLYGAKATNEDNLVFPYSGGEGGFSRIRFTMDRNVEYVIAGLTDFVQAPFIYRKATLIACVGQGGEAGRNSRGGFGGGVNIAGENGVGRFGGRGGARIPAGTLTSPGIFGSRTKLTATSPDTKATGTDGGRTLPCTRGVYYRDQGVSACDDVGNVKFRMSDGTEVSNTGEIERGYKAGYNIIQTKGEKAEASVSNLNSGRGGSGATGGDGGNNNYGGGGGSGYTNGSVSIISTQLGGSTFTDAKVIIRIAKLPTTGSINHSFNNSSNTNTLFEYDGAIVYASTEAMDGPDQAVGVSLQLKHYLITMNRAYTSINVVSISSTTAGGGSGVFTGGPAKVEKVDDLRWRLWFKKNNGYNTFVRGFSVEGIE